MDTSGLDHVVLTVSDLERARAFYGDLLGFEILEEPEYGAVLLYFMVGGVEITLVHHSRTPPGDRFSEFRIGLDHLSFVAPDEAALRALADRLIAAGVDTRGVETYAPNGKRYVAFRDPDNIQLEYWLNQPGT
ncbi:MAG TPA: VOC family protein [Aggregatilineaceae bacterium]|nr:VOC family protein [Aggregatilineaceae bacterium]